MGSNHLLTIAYYLLNHILPYIYHYLQYIYNIYIGVLFCFIMVFFVLINVHPLKALRTARVSDLGHPGCGAEKSARTKQPDRENWSMGNNTMAPITNGTAKTGWWFKTCFIFHILGMSSSQLTNSYFSEG